MGGNQDGHSQTLMLPDRNAREIVSFFLPSVPRGIKGSRYKGDAVVKRDTWGFYPAAEIHEYLCIRLSTHTHIHARARAWKNCTRVQAYATDRGDALFCRWLHTPLFMRLCLYCAGDTYRDYEYKPRTVVPRNWIPILRQNVNRNPP